MGVDTLSADRKTAGVSRADVGSVTHVVLEGVKEFKTKFTGVGIGVS